MTDEPEKTPDEIVSDLRDWIKGPELLELLKISDTTLYRWIREQGFPSGTKWAPKMVRWRLSEVNAWVAKRAEAAAQQTGKERAAA